MKTPPRLGGQKLTLVKWKHTWSYMLMNFLLYTYTYFVKGFTESYIVRVF
jgi:hypothetical protein